ncbi:HAD family hydrolase [Staphylococcus haemolyticus]|uniref:HAD-IIB family hydrolase n=1 Tax=Staphylococcus haemolyticus TaxID=1283 RepID=UPI00051DA45A|nr:HAD family hydrolase [Staphylococcus haemolyticus]KGJ25459.1 hydrolase [Staphylococcus haemolyticus]KGJ29155.1 hydrolase [Staphylococcus haemolyticus]MCH4326299.1 Cof-type HAD-IIB family hydrolase [Staphylococcus haemolyticus]MCH4414177.1 Cof-type HAD-IIB family hydrolase [Staphylococcus haemolyticus]MCH4418984.1 Cof-type HAD-IIB family hydrolase [Staphylococcus haemolyticus]
MNIVLDIDGTICFDGRQIDCKIIDQLFSLHNIGHKIIFASARPIRDLLPVLPNKFHEFALIGGNGSIISINGRIQTLATIQPESFNVIKHVINQYDLNYIVDDEWNYAARVDATNIIYQRLDPHRLAQKLTINEITSPIKTILLNIDEKDFDEVVTYLATNAPSLSLINHSNELNIDITAKYINKFTAIKHILGKYPTYVAFGNDHNDIEMLQHAKVGYFVNNESMDASILKNNKNIRCINANPEALCLSLNELSKDY